MSPSDLDQVLSKVDYAALDVVYGGPSITYQGLTADQKAVFQTEIHELYYQHYKVKEMMDYFPGKRSDFYAMLYEHFVHMTSLKKPIAGCLCVSHADRLHEVHYSEFYKGAIVDFDTFCINIKDKMQPTIYMYNYEDKKQFDLMQNLYTRGPKINIDTVENLLGFAMPTLDSHLAVLQMRANLDQFFHPQKMINVSMERLVNNCGLRALCLSKLINYYGL